MRGVILEVILLSLLYHSKNDVAFKIITLSKFNSDQSQAQQWDKRVTSSITHMREPHGPYKSNGNFQK